MRSKYLITGLIVLAALLFSAGCSGAGAPQATTTSADDAVPVVVRADNTVIAEAVLEPARWSELSFDLGGEIVEVLAQEGESVAGGAPLLRVDVDELENALQSARQDVVAQEAALEQLKAGATEKQIARADKDNADQVVQAEVALRAAELRLEQARAEDPAAEVDAARARIAQLERQLAQARSQAPTAEITMAQVAVERAQIALDDAQNEYNKALDRPWEDQGIRDGWARELVQKQLDRRRVQAQLGGAQSAYRGYDLGLEVIEAQIEAAEIQLTQAISAQASYAIALEALEADVEAAHLQVEALRTWDNPYRDQATAPEIAQAEAHLQQTELAVARLEMQIDEAELHAPFEGTVVKVLVEPGDRVNPGQAVLVLATLDQLEAHTIDLTELDVAQVTVGQPVVMSVDALPDVEFGGAVSEVSLRAEDYRGDVVYAVTVELGDVADLPLRWGMTTMVKIQTR